LFTASAQLPAGPHLGVSVVDGATVDYYTQHTGAALTGDTPAFTMWLPSGTFFYVPPGGQSSAPVRVQGALYGLYNDGSDPASANLALVKLTRLDFATPKNTQIELVNAMTGFGSNAAQNVPAGWRSQYTSGAGDDASWKANNGWSQNGHLFLPVYRQASNSPFYTAYDSTIIRSDDGGLHWCNPYTLSLTPDGHCPSNASEFAASGLGSLGYTLERLAGGDAPLPPSDPSYSAPTPSILFPAATPEASFITAPILTCQDETIGNGLMTCPSENGHDRYMYLLATDGNRRTRRLARILRSKLEGKYNTSDFSVYTCPTQWTSEGPCDGMQPQFWTSSLSAGTIVHFDEGTFGDMHSLSSAVFVPQDSTGNRTYLLVGKSCGMAGPCLAGAETSPKPWGPWTQSKLSTPPDDDFFYYPMLPTFQLSSDGHFQMAVASSPRISFPREGSPYFHQYSFSAIAGAGRPATAAASLPPRARSAVVGKLKLRYCTGAHELGCIPTNGLVSALEFAEPEGYDWSAPVAGFQQAFPRPYAGNVIGPPVCIVTGGHDSNRQWQGTNSLGAPGWGMMLDSLYYGFRDKCVLYDGKGPATTTAINTHSTPAPLTGDQDWTVVTVFKLSNTTANGIYLWSSLNCTPANYPPCSNAGGGGGVQATASSNFTNLTGQGKGDGSLGLMFDVAGGTLLNCCAGVATAPGQLAAGSIYAVAYVKKAGTLNVDSVSGANPLVKIWRGSAPYTGQALTLFGGNGIGPPRTSPNNYFYFGWADSTGSTSVAGNHADVTYYYNLIYSRTLTDSEWLGLYDYLKTGLRESPAGLIVE
jgi:hypothetical protein